jgi:hypothetical protein
MSFALAARAGVFQREHRGRWRLGGGGQARRPVEIAEVPFEITIGLSFDKETIDINKPKKR